MTYLFLFQNSGELEDGRAYLSWIKNNAFSFGGQRRTDMEMPQDIGAFV
jgi:hypothetical protein